MQAVIALYLCIITRYQNGNN